MSKNHPTTRLDPHAARHESVASMAHRYRLMQAEELLREYGYVPVMVDGKPTGDWQRPVTTRGQ